MYYLLHAAMRSFACYERNRGLAWGEEVVATKVL